MRHSVCIEMIELRQWNGGGKASARRSSSQQASSSSCGSAAVGCWRDNCPAPRVGVGTGLSAVVSDARLHEALRSMYIPPSQLRLGSTIGRGLSAELLY